MFQAYLCPSSGAYQLQKQPLVYRRNVVVAVLLAVVGPVVARFIKPDRIRPTALLPPRSYGKPEAAAAVDRLLMMGVRMPETC
jgi:DNA-binding helix-hairpin-helix protein with protein kinase domain